MPVIEHIEVATGGYPYLPPASKGAAMNTNKDIFCVMKAGPDYVMQYTEDTLKNLVNHMFAGDDVIFTPDGDKQTTRTIVHKSDQTSTHKDRIFFGAIKVKKN